LPSFELRIRVSNWGRCVLWYQRTRPHRHWTTSVNFNKFTIFKFKSRFFSIFTNPKKKSDKTSTTFSMSRMQNNERQKKKNIKIKKSLINFNFKWRHNFSLALPPISTHKVIKTLLPVLLHLIANEIEHEYFSPRYFIF